MKIIRLLILSIIVTACGGNTLKKPEHLKDVEIKISNDLSDYPIIKNNDITKIIVPDEFSKDQVFRYEDILDSIWYLPLKTHENAQLMSIKKLVVHNKSLFILDNSLKALLRFDKDGNFLNRIGSFGKGPGEYLDPTAFNITDNYIIIFDDRAEN